MSQKGLRVEFTVPRPRKPQKETLAPGDPVPRIARLLALAHKWEGMVQRGEVKDLKDIAHLMGVTPARVTQIANLTLVAADLQEELLLADDNTGHQLAERRLRSIHARPRWSEQRRLWSATRQRLT